MLGLNLLDVLVDALNGDHKAHDQLERQIDENLFNKQELIEVMKFINNNLLSDDPREKIYALRLNALCNYYGVSGSIDIKKTISFIDEAVTLNCSAAMADRAWMHVKGIGGFKNYYEAIRLYDNAIKLGNVGAMYLRARMHEKGKGGSINHSEAMRLYQTANDRGYPLAKKRLESINEQQTVLNCAYENFIDAISVLKQKINDFTANPAFATNKKLQKAHKKAAWLFLALKARGDIFFVNKPSIEDFHKFKRLCKEDIDEAREVLDKNRGWRKILLNLLAMIVTAGIGYAIAAGINIAVNRGKFTFFSTDSSQKLTKIEAYIENEVKKIVALA